MRFEQPSSHGPSTLHDAVLEHGTQRGDHRTPIKTALQLIISAGRCHQLVYERVGNHLVRDHTLPQQFQGSSHVTSRAIWISVESEFPTEGRQPPLVRIGLGETFAYPTGRIPTARQDNIPKLTSVAIVGDATSLAKGPDSWVERTARALDWQVTNLSAPGMGFTKVASRCADRCTTFKGVIPAVADAKPDIVVVFGSMADGDYPIGPESREFFTALRKAAPKTTIVALSPVMTKQGQLGWIRLHRNNIKAAVAAVDGRFVDIGQPAFRSGALSAKGQEQVSKRVVSALG